MTDLVSSLLPEPLPPVSSLLLIVVSFLTSALTAAVGLGGGVALVAVMANLMPVIALVPVHGVVQLGSNIGRAFVQLGHVDWRIVIYFTVGAAFGAAIGGSIAISLQPDLLRLGIAIFVLWTVWGRPPRFGQAPRTAMAAAGFVATLLSMFFGASGPIGGAVLSTLGLSRHGFVANQAVTAAIMHLFKIIAFGVLGFAFAPWLGLIGLMIASGFLGTLLGSRLLGHMNEASFKMGFKVVMTLLAANLLLRASGDY